jgi:hypothetical protein
LAFLPLFSFSSSSSSSLICIFRQWSVSKFFPSESFHGWRLFKYCHRRIFRPFIVKKDRIFINFVITTYLRIFREKCVHFIFKCAPFSRDMEKCTQYIYSYTFEMCSRFIIFGFCCSTSYINITLKAF